MAEPTWTTACPDWERRIVARESLIPCPPLFPEEAKAALDVLDQLRMVDMPGSPTWGEVSLPWLRDFVASIFGAYDTDSGRRLIREWFLLISKKNSKSSTAGLVMLTFLILNWRQAGEFGILAPTVEVANNAFKPAADAIKADEELSALLHVQDHIRTITHRVTKATLQVVAADSDTVAGKKWIVTLIDELWLFGKKANAEDMLREATGGLASRPEGCVLWLSTQSNEPPAGVFRQKLQYARGVRDGRIKDPQFCPVLYEFPERMLQAGEHRLPANFYVTNPNMGASVDEEFLNREFAKAEEAGEESVRGFMSKHLDVEIGLALRADRWRGADWWEGAGKALTLDDLLNRCDVVEIGIDGGGLDDLLGLCVLGREADSGQWLHWAHAWAHVSVLQLRKSEAPLLLDLQKEGTLTLVDEIGQDVEQVADVVEQCEASGLLDKIGCDPAGIGSIVDAITGRGFPLERIVGVSQGWRLAGAIKTAERKLAEGKFTHGGTRLMAWCVGNARIEPRANSVLITKQASGTGKIDPLMATLNATELLSRNPQPQRSFWESAA
ncbi:terminase large subunit [Roseateles puraquae]|uniref:terminase large subunit n=1 Tax=Roseateles puraquae TaxID=431059 RepID=UPI0031E42F2E